MASWLVSSFFSSSPKSTTKPTATTNSAEIFDESKKQETIELLCERLQSAVRIEDRRDALRSLKQISKKWKLEVATGSMNFLTEILKGDREDLDLIQLVLEILLNLMTFDPLDDQEQKNLPNDIVVQFTEVFAKESQNVNAILELTEEIEFNVRRKAMLFLTVLLKNCTKRIQTLILESGPMAAAKLVDLLQDEREIIRNDALLLIQIFTESNSNIQKIVAFENGFERLFEILISEGACRGDVVVADCFNVLLNLLKNNPSNQSFFRESAYIRRLAEFFQLNSIGVDRWTTQKNENVFLLLQIIRTLVSPTNSNQNLLSCQRNISQCGLLHRLCVLLTLTNIPAEILAELINTIAEIIRGHNENQQFFASVINTTSDDQQPLLNSLIYTMIVREKQLFKLRIAILYCFQSFMYKNDYGRSLILQTLLPQNENVANQYTIGHLIIVGLLSKDPVASWCASISLAHLISDNQQYKEALLQVVLNVSENQTSPKSLMEISIDLLENLTSPVQTRVAILIFLCTWLANCQLAVQQFLTMSTSISYLISQISLTPINDDREIFISALSAFALGLCLIFNNNQISTATSESLEGIIQKRIGIDVFQDKLESLSKLDLYPKTLQKPQIQIKNLNEMLLDYEFVRLYKILEGSITKSLTTPKQSQQSTNNVDSSAALLKEYYQYIEQQNQQIQFYREQEKQFQEERRFYQSKMVEFENALQYYQYQANSASKNVDQSLFAQQQAELEYLRNQIKDKETVNGVVKDEKSLQTDYVPQVYSSSNDENLVQQLHQSQLENRILQEKLVNEQRKVAILQGLQGQIEELIDEKTKLNDEYQRLNLAYEKTFQEHQKLLNFCSNYQHQLNETKTFIQTSGLKIPEFLVGKD